MKDQWYGDNRDLVKWGVLLHLARNHGASRIIQVAYWRPSAWPLLQIGGDEYEIPDIVHAHFRKLRAVTELSKEPQIQVINTEFSDRRAYTQHVSNEIANHAGECCLVFLDPDTGLEPRNPGREHVLESELGEIWRQMSPDSILVFYQHRVRERGWIERKRKQFERALGPGRNTAEVATGFTVKGKQKIVLDVAFFFCQKGNITTGRVTTSSGATPAAAPAAAPHVTQDVREDRALLVLTGDQLRVLGTPEALAEIARRKATRVQARTR